MKEIESLIKKALKYKESGLTDYEIGEELNVSKETAAWLLNKGKEKKPVGDVKIGWRSIGVYPSRIGFISDTLCDIILEECEQIDTIVGIAEDRQSNLLAIFQSNMSDITAWMTNEITRAEWYSRVTKKAL